MDEVLENLDVLLDNPEILGRATPDEWYKLLKQSGYYVKPLGKGNFGRVPYTDGGGYRVNWNGKGGACILQYHPEERSHHVGAYYKIGNGVIGKKWFKLDGTPLTRSDLNED